MSRIHRYKSKQDIHTIYLSNDNGIVVKCLHFAINKRKWHIKLPTYSSAFCPNPPPPLLHAAPTFVSWSSDMSHALCLYPVVCLDIGRPLRLFCVLYCFWSFVHSFVRSVGRSVGRVQWQISSHRR